MLFLILLALEIPKEIKRDSFLDAEEGEGNKNN